MIILILSDGRMGHLNQSIALASHLGAQYQIIPVSFTCKACKFLSYVFDFFKIYTHVLFKQNASLPPHGDILVCAGSSTYYAAKVFARKLGIKSVCMMLPQNYRYDFDLIFAQEHDNPPKQPNIVPLPANFSFVRPKGLFSSSRKSIGIIIGGNNAQFKIDSQYLKNQLNFIVEYFKDYEIAVTTSPRTPQYIETLLESYPFSYRVIFSQNKINPIADFLHHCEMVFITMDSTSMISEASSYGNSFIEILPPPQLEKTKFYTFCLELEKNGYLHIFDGTLGFKNKKIDFQTYAQKVLV